MPEEEQKPMPVTESAPPIGVKVKKRAVMVNGSLVEMPEKDQIKDGRENPEGQ